jgi:signal transduction histidine kinase
MGLTSVLTDVDLDRSMQIDLMGDLTMSAQKLDNVISDLNSILGLKHTENKQKELVRFSTLMQDIQVSMESLIKENEVKIISDFSAIDELFTLKSYLYSIFYNLLSNSIKYRRANAAPVLEVTSAKDHNKVALTFKDNGLGIDLKKRGDEVFGLYKRFHTHVNGKGMGLFMVKTQVESLGGTISIESEVNKGTTFTVEFELS